MNTGKELLFFFSALGAFNGIVLSIYFFFFTRKKYLVNYLLGALLLALSIRVGKSVFLYFDGTLPKIYLQIGLSACFFIGPFLYYFLKAAMLEINEMPRSWKWTILSLFLLTIVTGTLYSYQSYPYLWNRYFAKVIYAQWLIYIVASGFVIRELILKVFKRGYKMKPSEVWLTMVYLGNLILFICYFLSLVRAPFSVYISGAIAFTLILYLIISILLYRKKTDDLFVLNKYAGKKVKDEDASLILKKLEKVMIEKEAYKNPDLKLSDLSQEIKLPSHQLSQLLNDNLGKNFTTFVNEFRINEACKIIISDQLSTLESIGYEVGFNSKSTFFSAFKKHTGTTPSNYQQNGLKTQQSMGTDL